MIAQARRRGWRVAAFPKIQDVKGIWRTPVAADGKGWPDLMLVRDRVVVMELKTGTSPTPSQFTWLSAFRLAGVEAYVIRPADWDAGLVDGILGRRDVPPPPVGQALGASFAAQEPGASYDLAMPTL